MAEQTREQKEMAIKLFTMSMWSAVVIFWILAALFYLEIIPTGQGTLIAICLGVVAIMDVILIKVMVPKMRAGFDNT